MENDLILTSTQAGMVLCCSGHTVYKLMDAGKITGWIIPSTSIKSRHRRFLLSEIIRYMKDSDMPDNIINTARERAIKAKAKPL